MNMTEAKHKLEGKYEDEAANIKIKWKDVLGSHTGGWWDMKTIISQVWLCRQQVIFFIRIQTCYLNLNLILSIIFEETLDILIYLKRQQFVIC